MTSSVLDVYAGVDTHAETHHVAVIDGLGRRLGDAEFPTTVAGYQQLLVFVGEFGTVQRIGVEGTASYGAGLTAYLRAERIRVREVIRPSRAARRQGKSDPIDAYAAARTVAADDDLPIPKLLDGDVERIRVTLRARSSAIKARSTAMVQIKDFLTTAPARVREAYRYLSDEELIEVLAASRPQSDQTLKRVLRRLARRYEYLGEEIDQAVEELEVLTVRVAPELTQARAIGTITAAQLLVTAGANPERVKSKAAFAALCGVSPIPASSGKTQRHRLNRGGDRQANWALHRIVMVRMGNDERTRRYVERRTAEGKGTREIMRCLKRYVANEVYTLILDPDQVPPSDDLRPLRHQQHLTLTQVADHFDTSPGKISRIERGQSRDDHFTKQYRKYLLQTL